ncbi:MAG: hypothetical protein EON89_03695 [Brevundimonas sp.]|nr:MAG: hypothetical protein EON89_03695 [Brevundimonas sp.]
MTAIRRIVATAALSALALGAVACTQQEAAPAAPAPAAAAPVETRTVVETREVPVAVPVPAVPQTVVERDRPTNSTTVRAGQNGIEVETTRPN